MSVRAVPQWDGRDLIELLTLTPEGGDRFATRLCDPNANGRTYGGQILAQALMAAGQTVPRDRFPTVIQFMFLQGTQVDEAVVMDVRTLQEGKRFSSRHVSGTQGGGSRIVLDGQFTFATPMSGPAHHMAPTDPLPDPQTQPEPQDLPLAWREGVRDALGYMIDVREVLDFRLNDPPERLIPDAKAPRFRFWMKVRQPLPDDPLLQAAAFAFLSDWWINYVISGPHLEVGLAQGGLYVASLNHSVWFHQPFSPNEWLHFDTVSPQAGRGRGLAVARIHTRDGRLVASVTQEALMTGRS